MTNEAGGAVPDESFSTIRQVFHAFTFRRVTMMVALIAAWCALWGEVSAANVLGGVLVALVVTTPGLGGAIGGGVRPVPFLRLVWLILVDLAKSTMYVSHEILTPNDHTSESIIAVKVPPEARRHMLLYTAAITLTPGTVVVDTDVEAGVLYIHLLHDGDIEANHTLVQRMAELAVVAFPAPGASGGRSVSTRSEGGRP